MGAGETSREVGARRFATVRERPLETRGLGYPPSRSSAAVARGPESGRAWRRRLQLLGRALPAQPRSHKEPLLPLAAPACASTRRRGLHTAGSAGCGGPRRRSSADWALRLCFTGWVLDHW